MFLRYATKTINFNQKTMKKFINENWFKLGILIIILTAGFFYFINNESTSKKTIILKEKCLKDGETYIKNNFMENPPETMTVSKEFVYSPELKTCLINISRITSPLQWYYAIIDIYTKKEIASYSFDKTDNGSIKSQSFIDSYKKYEDLKNKYFSKK